jgi:hypothetical protein
MERYIRRTCNFDYQAFPVKKFSLAEPRQVKLLGHGSQLTEWPLLALFAHAAISELSLLSGVKQKSDLEPAKGSFWR